MLEHEWLVYCDVQATVSSVAMKLSKEATFRLVADYRVVNQQVQSVPWPQPNIRQAPLFIAGANRFSSFDLLQGF